MPGATNASGSVFSDFIAGDLPGAFGGELWGRRRLGGPEAFGGEPWGRRRLGGPGTPFGETLGLTAPIANNSCNSRRRFRCLWHGLCVFLLSIVEGVNCYKPVWMQQTALID